MPKLTADEVVTQQHKRAFIQWGGPRPNNPVAFAGQDAQYMSITGVSVPEAGGFDAINVPQDGNSKRFKSIGRMASVPDLASATLTFYEKHGYLPRQLFKSCPFSFYEVTGVCMDLSDMYHGVTDYMMIYSMGLVSTKNLGDRVTFESDDVIGDELEINLSDAYPAGAMGFGDNALTLIDREVLDVTYGTKQTCGNCGPENDGSKQIYAITRSSGGSPGLPAELIYSVDGGANWSQTTITGIGATEDPSHIEAVGSKLIVLSRTAGSATQGGYYWAEIDQDTGIPGTWTKVTAGFVASAQPNSAFVLSPREVFFVADAGYIYKSTDIASGVTVLNAGAATTQNLNHIRGSSDALVAVGAAGTVVRSTNRGATWATTQVAPTTSMLQAVEVFDQRRIWVGSVNGYIWYTLDGGKSWTRKGFSGEGTGQVFDIMFATEEVGYMLHGNATPTARLFCTLDGGVTWSNDCWRIVNWPTFNYAKHIAIPTSSDSAVNVNNVAIAGITSANDGVLLVGIAPKI
jgi:photosystem II stability/assembly factor-like uncharacterized protein